MIDTKQKKIFSLIKSELITKTLHSVFEDNSFGASFFSDEKELLMKLSNARPDLIILDFEENDTKIIDFYIVLKTNFQMIPIILMLSNSHLNKIKDTIEQKRPNSIVVKPFKLMELLDKITKVLYSGDLERYPFTFLLQTFLDERRTGVLHITVESVKYFIYFIGGQVVYIEYGLREDTLGMLLLKQGRITEEQYNIALRAASRSSSRLGVALIKLGYLTPADLNDALKGQVHDKIIRCFAADTGAFSFKPNSRFVEDIIIYKMDTSKIILDGVKKHYDLKRLDTFLKTIKSKKFKIKSDLFNSIDIFQFNTEEMKIVSKLRTPSHFDELVLKPDIDMLLLTQILYTLSVTRYLVVANKTDDIKEEAKAPSKQVKPEERLAETKEQISKKEMIYETYLKIKSLNYYEILDISRNAELETMKRSYVSLVKKFHPDKFAKEGDPDILSKANEIFSKVSNAFRTLSDSGQKSEYDYKLDHPNEAEILSSANEIIKSEMEFLRGEKLLNNRAFAKAQEAFEIAMKLNPEEPEYKCYFGWAIFLNPDNPKVKKVSLAKKYINEALEVNPKIEIAYYFLGVIARFEENIDLAIENFKKVLGLNPNNIDARRALKLLFEKVKK